MLPKWNLKEIYEDNQQIEDDKIKITQLIDSFSKSYRGKILQLKSCELLQSIIDYEDIANKTQKLAVYARLLSFVNLDNKDIQRFYQETIEFLTAQEQKLIFYTIDLNKIDDSTLNSYQESTPGLAFYSPWLRRLRAFKPYQLDEQLEQLLNDKSTTSTQMWIRLYDETISKLRFSFDGQEFGIAAISHLMSDKDSNIRKKAAESMDAVWSKNQDIFTMITNVLAKDLEILDKWRGYKNIAESRHLSNDVEACVVDNLLMTVKRNYSKISHRFYRLKAKLLGVEKISYIDRNAPLPFDDDKIYSFDEAKSIVLTAYGSFDSEIKDLVQKFFDYSWIDAEESASKYPGAFNMPTYKGHHPYILLNYKGKLRDVTTLAHELGHGIHSLLADDQGILMSHAPLTFCETASVFGEMLTFQHLLKLCTNKKERIKALEGKLSDMINTVVRQIAFYDFECQLHLKRREGKELSTEDINQIWVNTQKEALGDYVDIPNFIENFWMGIPHFIHSPFYVYAYAFGDCLVNSLYQYYKDKSDGFIDLYKNLLKAGGSQHHIKLLSPFELDASKPDFWETGLNLIISLLDQLEEEMKD